jgi:hypothetical protein
MISKDGSKKRKRSPQKAFTESDRYTVRTHEGKQLLVAERTLGATEDAFVRIRPKIEGREELDLSEKLHLCAFATAMFARSKSQGDHFGEFFRSLNNLVEQQERKRGAEPKLSLETKMHAENAPASTIAMFMLSWPQMFLAMNLTILCTDEEEGFLTSDQPFVMNDPEGHKLPPAHRYPVPGGLTTESTLPLTPRRLLLISRLYAPGYIDATKGQIDELNARVRFGCKETFVSWKGIIRDCWFAPGKKPEGSWEESLEGIESEKNRQAYLEAKAKWEARKKERNN